MRRATALVAVLLLAGCQPATPLSFATSGVPASSAVSTPVSTTVANPFSVMGLQNRPLPNPLVTPGVANPDVTQANIGSTICVSGWTSTIRPPVSYTGPLKVAQIKQYGYTDSDPSHYEEDHLIALEDGGNPTDPANLWPEPLTATLPDGTSVGFHVKDHLENYLKAMVCSGAMTLAAAQTALSVDWVSAWTAAGKP